jgi:hypothetical protein
MYVMLGIELWRPRIATFSLHGEWRPKANYLRLESEWRHGRQSQQYHRARRRKPSKGSAYATTRNRDELSYFVITTL